MGSFQDTAAGRWCLVVPLPDAYRTATFRAEPGVEVCAVGSELWLLGHRRPRDTEELLHRVPGAWVAWVLDNDDLVPVGRRVPVGRLPAGDWQPWGEGMAFELPAISTRLARRPTPIGLQLARSATPQPCQLLRAGWELWSDYAHRAPQWRLERLAFACHGQGEVLVRGEPLPPLPGCRYAERDGVAVAAGWSVRPDLDPRLLRQIFALAAGDVALVAPGASASGELTWQRIVTTDWVRATRGAVRATEERLRGHG